jgi:hypothetical protein
MPKGGRPFGIAPPGERRAGLDPLYYEGVVDLHLRSLPEPKGAFGRRTLQELSGITVSPT